MLHNKYWLYSEWARYTYCRKSVERISTSGWTDQGRQKVMHSSDTESPGYVYSLWNILFPGQDTKYHNSVNTEWKDPSVDFAS